MLCRYKVYHVHPLSLVLACWTKCQGNPSISTKVTDQRFVVTLCWSPHSSYSLCMHLPCGYQVQCTQRLQIIFLPVCIFIWEGQWVQESTVQQHELVVDPSDLQRSKRRETERKGGINFYVDGKGDNNMSVHVSLCSYVSFARSELWITWSKWVAALRKLATARFSGSETRHRSTVQPLGKDFILCNPLWLLVGETDAAYVLCSVQPEGSFSSTYVFRSFLLQRAFWLMQVPVRDIVDLRSNN